MSCHGDNLCLPFSGSHPAGSFYVCPWCDRRLKLNHGWMLPSHAGTYEGGDPSRAQKALKVAQAEAKADAEALLAQAPPRYIGGLINPAFKDFVLRLVDEKGVSTGCLYEMFRINQSQFYLWKKEKELEANVTKSTTVKWRNWREREYDPLMVNERRAGRDSVMIDFQQRNCPGCTWSIPEAIGTGKVCCRNPEIRVAKGKCQSKAISPTTKCRCGRELSPGAIAMGLTTCPTCEVTRAVKFEREFGPEAEEAFEQRAGSLPVDEITDLTARIIASIEGAGGYSLNRQAALATADMRGQARLAGMDIYRTFRRAGASVRAAVEAAHKLYGDS